MVNDQLRRNYKATMTSFLFFYDKGKELKIASENHIRQIKENITGK